MTRRTTKIIFYKDKAGFFRWRAMRSGRIVADSGEGYRSQKTGINSVTRLLEAPYLIRRYIKMEFKATQ